MIIRRVAIRRSAAIVGTVFAFGAMVAGQVAFATPNHEFKTLLAWRMKEPPNAVDKDTEKTLEQLRAAPNGQRTELIKKYIEQLSRSSATLQHSGKEGIAEFAKDESAVLGVLRSLNGTDSQKDIASFMCDEITEGHNLSDACSAEAIKQYHDAKDAFVRRELVRTFHNCSRLGNQKLRTALFESIAKDSDPTVRAYAAEELGDLGPQPFGPQVFDILAKAYESDNNALVKEQALSSLCLVPARKAQAVPIVRKALKSDNPVIKIRAINAVQALGPAGKDLIPELATVLKAPDFKTGTNSAHLSATHSLMMLGKLAAPAVPELRESLKDPNLRNYSLKALEEIGPAAAPAVPDIIAMLKQDSMTKTAAAKALGGIGPKSKSALPALKDALAHPAPDDFDYVKAALNDAIKKIQAQ